MFVVDFRGNLYQYSPKKGMIIHQFKRSDFKYRSIAITPNKKSVFASDHFGNLYEFDIKTHKQLNKISKKNVGRILVSPDGKYLFTSTLFDYQTIKIWSIKTKKIKNS